jgi:hypothetical protein
VFSLLTTLLACYFFLRQDEAPCSLNLHTVDSWRLLQRSQRHPVVLNLSQISVSLFEDLVDLVLRVRAAEGCGGD